MERLTKRTDKGIAYLANVKQDEQEVEGSKNTLECLYESWQRLADYEDKYKAKKVVLKPFNEIMRMKVCHNVNCPTCDYNFMILEFENDKTRRFAEYAEYQRYCNKCGQKLDWVVK